MILEEERKRKRKTRWENERGEEIVSYIWIFMKTWDFFLPQSQSLFLFSLAPSLFVLKRKRTKKKNHFYQGNARRWKKKKVIANKEKKNKGKSFLSNYISAASFPRFVVVKFFLCFNNWTAFSFFFFFAFFTLLSLSLFSATFQHHNDSEILPVHKIWFLSYDVEMLTQPNKSFI